uniref:Uncharacterized protein n=1 Tax=Anguilla anguilla TaxID=7936 RepID=A0A0E9TAA3_ANGAN
MVCFKALSRILGFSRIAQGRSHVSLQISPFADRLCVLLLFIFYKTILIQDPKFHIHRIIFAA